MEDDESGRHSAQSDESEKFALEKFLAEAEPMEQHQHAEGRKVGPPVDYTFRDLKTLDDLCKVDPRDWIHPYVTIPLDIPDQNLAEREKKENENGKKTKFVKYCTNALRVNNNDISSLENMETSLKAIIDEPTMIEWLDISFNYITKLNESLLKYENLKVLYLHANNIEDIHEIDKLAALPKLKTITLHGNVLEGIKGYRQYVIATLPQIEYLDFSRITPADRKKASVWKSMKLIGVNKRKKRQKAEA